MSKYCPGCGSISEDNARICARCGRAFQPLSTPVRPAQAYAQPARVNYTAPAPAALAPAAPKSSKAPFIVSICIGGVAIITALVLFFTMAVPKLTVKSKVNKYFEKYKEHDWAYVYENDFQAVFVDENVSERVEQMKSYEKEYSDEYARLSESEFKVLSVSDYPEKTIEKMKAQMIEDKHYRASDIKDIKSVTYSVKYYDSYDKDFSWYVTECKAYKINGKWYFGD